MPKPAEYNVTVTFQYPAWDEKNGITVTVYASSKSEAIKRAKFEFRHNGHIGPDAAASHGRATLRAEWVRDISDAARCGETDELVRMDGLGRY